MGIDQTTTLGDKRIGWELGTDPFDPEKPSLVLVHGSGGSRASWTRLYPQLGDRMNVLALELPGHGQSSGPPLETVAEAAAFVMEAITAKNFPRPPYLGGHSLGGAVAIEAGLARPDLFSGLILLGSGAKLAVNPAIFDGLSTDPAGTLSLVGVWSFFKEADPAVVAEVSKALAAVQPSLVANDFHACDRFDRREDLGRITLPTLVACGRHDKMTHPKLSEALAQGIPGARLELIDRAGHFLVDEQPAALAEAIKNFIR